MKQIILPIKGEDIPLQSEQSFVIIGANGSGKSHLGAYIEKSDKNNVLRISAQRALSVPEYVTVRSEQVAWNQIFYGNEKQKDKNYKWAWGHETTQLINDYDNVLEAVFARMSNEKDKYFKACRECEKQYTQKPDTPQIISDKIIDIWNSVFPHRKILIEDNLVKAKTDKNEEYSAKNMSDGERVAIYLIGQCLVAPKDVIIVIDEPEIHLHKAIMHKLWDKIEEYCPDNAFVYITHDLDFASSRKQAKKIWVKNYSIENHMQKWDIEVLEEHDFIPENLMIEVLGNRKNVLFVEGEKGSYDSLLYSYIYEDYYIIPCHNCYKVIELTKAFNEERLKGLHNISVQGIIDRDYLTETEIEAYKENGIYPLIVAEVENLYLLSEIQRIIAEHMALENIPQVLEDVKNYLFKCFEDEKETQITAICERELQYKLGRFQKNGNGLVALNEQYLKYTSLINVSEMYHKIEERVNTIMETRDLDRLLMIYNRKSLHRRISKFFKLSNDDYPQMVLRLLKTDKKQVIVSALKKHMPQL